MPHNRFDWASRIKTAEREYHAVRVAVDWLLGATPDEIHDVIEERGWDDLARAYIYAADRNLDATYLIRMFSVFERAIFSYWRLLPGNDVRDVEGDVRLDEVGDADAKSLLDEAFRRGMGGAAGCEWRWWQRWGGLEGMGRRCEREIAPKAQR